MVAVIIVKNDRRSEQVGSAFATLGIRPVAERTGSQELLVTTFDCAGFVGRIRSASSSSSAPLRSSRTLRACWRGARLRGWSGLGTRRLRLSKCCTKEHEPYDLDFKCHVFSPQLPGTA